jgi:homoserine kinase type II
VEGNVRAFLARYGRQPRSLTVEPLTGGVVNLILRIAADGEELVLRRYDRTEPDEVAWELALLRHLSGHGFPTAPLIATTDGALSTPFEGRPAALFGFVEGRPPDARSATALGEIGAALARLHEVTAGLELGAPRRHKEARNRLRRFVSTAADPALGTLVGDVERFDAELGARLERLGGGLPRGIVHADAHPGNLLVDPNDRLLALLDFDDAHVTFLVAEVACLVLTWGLSRETYRLVPEWATAAVDAYARHRPLTAAEWELLPDFVALDDLLSAIAYVSWRVDQGMPAAQAVEWCSSYGRYRETTAGEGWRERLRRTIQP